MRLPFWKIKNRKLAGIITLVISLCVLKEIYYIGQVMDNLGSVGQLYYVTTNGSDIDEGMFVVSKIEEIRNKKCETSKEESTLDYTYTYEKEVEVKVINQTVPRIHMVVTNGDYSKIYGMQIKEGSFLNEAYSKQVVVDEEMAFSLFGSEDIIGQSLEIENQIFYVVGISRTEKGRPHGSLYIQSKDFKEYEVCKVKGILFSEEEGGVVQGKSEIYSFLSKLNIKKEHVKIVQVSHYK